MEASIRDKYQEVIGLEIHVQLLTNTKAYSSDVNEYGSLPNTNVSVVTLAHPGTLPRSNTKVFDYAIKLGLACHCAITEYNYYDRKNYFYPDLPKGYQLTQDQTPICVGGYIPITTKSGLKKDVRLNRIHMEEDAGKSMHLEGETETMVDLNRAGVPLLEVVTEPDLNSSEEAYALLTEIRKLVRYLEICDGNMEEGSLRCDANISVRLKESDTLGTKVEVKNMNSIRNVQRAIDFEIDRQIKMIESKETFYSETRLFDAVNGTTHGMRTKEAMNDYRYFPEPDLQPVVVTEEWISKIKESMPALPAELIEKFTGEYGLPDYDAVVLTDNRDLALFFEEVCKHTKNYKAASNWMMGAVKSYLNELTLHIKDFPLSPERIAEIVQLVDDNKIAASAAKMNLFPAMIKNPEKSALKVAEENNLIQESDQGSIKSVIDEILKNHPEEVQRYKEGKKALLGMFMGQVMKASKGKADPKMAKKLLTDSLENE